MNILIVGSGAREHAIAKAVNRSTAKKTLYCLGTNQKRMRILIHPFHATRWCYVLKTKHFRGKGSTVKSFQGGRGILDVKL